MAGVRKRLGSLLGPTGRAAGFGTATAQTVPAGQPAEVTLSGPSTAKNVHIKIPAGPQGLPGTGAVPADEAVAGYVSTTGESATKAAVFAAIESRQTMIDVRDYGAVGDGIADDTAAIQAAFDDAAGGVWYGRDAVVFMPFGTYKVSSPLTCLTGIDAAQATINYTGIGTALTVGDATTAAVIVGRTLRLPAITCVTNTAASAWSATPINGIRLINLNDCRVFARETRHFNDGLILEGNDGGFAHNDIWVGTLWGNRRNLVLNVVGTGWVNQNVFYGGRHVPNITWGIDLDPYACAGVYFVGTIAGPNNNTWIGTSFEGGTGDLYRLDVSGFYNYFINCRFEHGVDEELRIRWRSGATANTIEGGYDAARIVEVFEPGARNNRLRPVFPLEFRATQIDPTTIPNTDVPTTLTNWFSPIGSGANYDPATGEIELRQGRWSVDASIHISAATSGVGYVIFGLSVNGVIRDIHHAPAVAGQPQKLRVAWSDDFETGDKVSFYIRNSTAEALTILTTPHYAQFRCEHLG